VEHLRLSWEDLSKASHLHVLKADPTINYNMGFHITNMTMALNCRLPLNQIIHDSLEWVGGGGGPSPTPQG